MQRGNAAVTTAAELSRYEIWNDPRGNWWMRQHSPGRGKALCYGPAPDKDLLAEIQVRNGLAYATELDESGTKPPPDPRTEKFDVRHGCWCLSDAGRPAPAPDGQPRTPHPHRLKPASFQDLVAGRPIYQVVYGDFFEGGRGYLEIEMGSGKHCLTMTGSTFFMGWRWKGYDVGGSQGHLPLEDFKTVEQYARATQSPPRLFVEIEGPDLDPTPPQRPKP